MRERHIHIRSGFAFLLGSVAGLMGCVDVVESDEVEQWLGTAEVDMAMALQTDYQLAEKNGRMTADKVQAEGQAFRGVNQLKLYATTDPMNGGKFEDNVNARFDFIPFTMNQPKLSFNDNQSQQKAMFESNVALPIGTNRFIGFASVNRPFGSAGTEDPKFFDEGVLVSNWTLEAAFDNKVATLYDFYFGPRSIRPTTLNSAETVDACRLLRLINRPLQVKANVTLNGKTKPMSWQEVALSNEETVLKTTYEEYTGNKAGAYKNIKSLLESVYYQLGVVASDGKSPYQQLAKDIRSRILNPADPIDVNDATSQVTTYTDDITFTVVNETTKDEVLFEIKDPLKDYSFPSTLFLPDGAATLIFKSGVGDDKWAQENLAFQFLRFNDKDASGTVGLPVYSYAYPAELLYRVNTPVKASDNEHSQEWNSSSATWSDFVSTHYVDNKLTATAKSLVLEQPLRYMVGCMESHAFIETAQDYLEDSSTPNALQVKIPAGGFPITGILVGMQNYVGWDGRPRQTPSSAGQEDLQYIYYDCQLNGSGKKLTKSAAEVVSYTLTLQSQEADFAALKDAQWGAAEGQRTKQIVMLELKNTSGMEFHGHEKQLIAKDTHFYLLGELNLYDEYQKDLKRDPAQQKFTDARSFYSVFEQGVTTKVTLRVTSLAGAYNSIPDLRNPSLKISLKTDWNWQNGFIFDNNFPLQP